MTKPYHLTQEQVSKIVGLRFGSTELMEIPINLLMAYANAALDKVLGEPVAYEYFDENADYHLTNEEPPEYVTATNLTPLYAPKERSSD